jgi:hypothetical protein
MASCYGEDNATKGNPSIFFVPLKIIYDVLWIYGFINIWIKFDEIEEANATNEYKPNANYWSKTISYFVGSKSLSHE